MDTYDLTAAEKQYFSQWTTNGEIRAAVDGRAFDKVYAELLPALHPIAAANHKPQLIVSLTSFPERIPRIYPALYSLLNQDLRPDRVILWLAPEEFLPPEREREREREREQILCQSCCRKRFSGYRITDWKFASVKICALTKN